MSAAILGFLLGMFVGAAFGVITLALVIAGRDDDK